MPEAPTLDWLPGADLSRRYDGKYPGGVRRDVEKLLLHSTETRPEWGCPGYSGGAAAPTLTISPWRQHRFVFQHFPLIMSARALVDSDSTVVRENRDGVIQVELVGDSDPTTNRGYDLRDLDDEELRWLAATLAPIFVAYSIPLVRPPLWPMYPDSYGQGPWRLTDRAYNDFRGVLGHLHAPGNQHGDPAFPVDRWMLMVRNILGAGGVATPIIVVPAPPAVVPDVAEPVDQKPSPPAAWDGKTFPGGAAFVLGQSHPAVKVLGQRLVAHGYARSHDGNGYQPGPRFTEHDLANTRAFQEAQGWSGISADGYPGPSTWERLMVAPATPPPPAPAPAPDPEEATVAKFPGTSFMTDGRTSDSALLVGRALVAAGFKGYKVGPSRTWGPADTEGVRWFQKKIGDDVDGKLGPKQWARLIEELDDELDAKPKPGQWYVNTDTLNGREKTSDNSKVKWTRKRGADLDVVEVKHADGRWWLGTGSGGAWYAAEFCTTKKPGGGTVPKGQSTGSVPAYRPKVACPVRPAKGVTTPYGRRKPGLWRGKGFHTGEDYPAWYGDDCIAVVDGTVTVLDSPDLGCIAVLSGRDSNGDLRHYWYCHVQKGSRVTGKVKAGDVIAKVSDTGNGAIGPHLHLEDKASPTNWNAADRDPRW